MSTSHHRRTSKPWIGTVAALTPDGAPKNNAAAPSAQLALEWVYGVKSDDTRQHVHIDARNRIVFPAAAGACVWGGGGGWVRVGEANK